MRRVTREISPAVYNCPMVNDPLRKEVGRIGERVAVTFLERKGYTIIERNYRKPWGEIDIIAEKGGVVRFVEVKAVSREMPGSVTREMSSYRPEEQVHPAKLKKICRTAEMYMTNSGDDREYQIDVVGVFVNLASRKAQCRLFEQVL